MSMPARPGLAWLGAARLGLRAALAANQWTKLKLLMRRRRPL